MGLIDVVQVTKVFSGRQRVHALDSVSFSMDSDEFVVILGPSGCGKTTLLRMLAGLEAPTSGSCFFDGQTISRPSRRRAYVFQEPRLFPWLSVGTNIRLGGGREGLSELVDRVGLAEFVSAYPHHLSGGMAKRAALARALASEPDVLLLDEPLANLDVPTRETLYPLLADIWRSGPACLLVTHDVDEALMLATRILLFSPRPGHLAHELLIELDFPRHRGCSEYQELRETIMELSMEVAKHEI